MPLSAFCSPTEKIAVIHPSSFLTEARQNKPHLQFFMKAFSSSLQRIAF